MKIISLLLFLIFSLSIHANTLDFKSESLSSMINQTEIENNFALCMYFLYYANGRGQIAPVTDETRERDIRICKNKMKELVVLETESVINSLLHP